MHFLFAFSGVIIALTILFRLYVKWAQKYWARKNVPYIKSESIWGNMENPFRPKRGLSFDFKYVHDELKRRGHNYGGMMLFTQPVFIAVDPELIKLILAKDFQHFVSRGNSFNEKKDPLAGNIFNLDGDKWRNMRVKITPTFTSGKMKMMFGTLLDCGVPMIEHINGLVKDGKSLDIKNILSCYTTDIIGSCAFGLECNSFKDPNAEFRKFGREVVAPTVSNFITLISAFFIPKIGKLLDPKLLNVKLESFFLGAIKGVVDYRISNKIKRNDFVQLFLEINEKAKINGQKPLTMEEIAAQAFVFLIAGFDTSATTMTFCLHELAFNQDIQEKLREEVRATMKKYDGKLTYDGIMEMEYMDQVVNETLRKYPPVPFLFRECTIDYKVPDTDITIEKGTRVFISALGLHRDEEYYPNPDKFDPERFTDENKATRPSYAFLPFGEGPRICIGLRFGLMQTKTGLSMLLNNYKILPGDDNSYNIEFDPKAFIFAKKGRVMLNAQKITV